MTTDVRRTNSYLKGLAETRARSAGDVIRYERLLGELGDLLEKARAEVAWCDGLIKKFDGRLDPTLIPPIHGRSAYGKRGSLKAAMFEILKRESPSEVSSTELCLELELRFGLDFPTPKHRYQWRRGTVIRELRRLAATEAEPPAPADPAGLIRVPPTRPSAIMEQSLSHWAPPGGMAPDRHGVVH